LSSGKRGKERNIGTGEKRKFRESSLKGKEKEKRMKRMLSRQSTFKEAQHFWKMRNKGVVLRSERAKTKKNAQKEDKRVVFHRATGGEKQMVSEGEPFLRGWKGRRNCPFFICDEEKMAVGARAQER